CCKACLRTLDTVVDAVAHEMHERIADLLEHRLVELRLFARDLQLDLLGQALAQVAHHAREAAEYEADRQHAHAHDAFLKLAHVPLELRKSGSKLLCDRPRHFRAELAEHRLSDHELAYG